MVVTAKRGDKPEDWNANPTGKFMMSVRSDNPEVKSKQALVRACHYPAAEAGNLATLFKLDLVGKTVVECGIGPAEAK